MSLGQLNADPFLIVALRTSPKPGECLSWLFANEVTRSEHLLHRWYASELPEIMLCPFRALEEAWAGREVARAAVSSQDALPMPPRASIADQKRAYQAIAPAPSPSAWSRIKRRRLEVMPEGGLTG